MRTTVAPSARAAGHGTHRRPLPQLSVTICAFCSVVQERRRPAPVKTPSRRTCSALDISISSVFDMCPTPLLQTGGHYPIRAKKWGRLTNTAYDAKGLGPLVSGHRAYENVSALGACPDSL